MERKVIAVVGSYRRGGTIDQAVEAVLAGAREKGAATQTIYLTERKLEFCTNCRKCTETPGPERGRCVLQDDMEPLLAEIEAADSVVLAAPVNFFHVTAIFRLFMERLIPYAYWPWGRALPRLRSMKNTRKAVLISSAAMPGYMIPIFSSATRALRVTAKMLGAKSVGRLWIGLAGHEPQQALPAAKLARARRLGWRLA
ncbi:MAG TPA: flavodoxin family protein [Acidobacteriaceae bacterium]